jgi:hypothetical protein
MRYEDNARNTHIEEMNTLDILLLLMVLERFQIVYETSMPRAAKVLYPKADDKTSPIKIERNQLFPSVLKIIKNRTIIKIPAIKCCGTHRNKV